MTDPGCSSETQVLQEHTSKSPPDELFKPAEPSPQLVPKSPKKNDAMDFNLSPAKGCPKMQPCPGKSEIPAPKEHSADMGDGDKLALERARNMAPGPLGPMPPGENVPLDFWTPLGGLTRTRPAVENFSLSRFSPSEWHVHKEKVSAACAEGIEVAAVAGFNARNSVSRAYAEADRNQMDNNLRLSARAGVIYRWRTELDRSLAEMVEELDLLEEAKRRTMRAKCVLQLVENIGKDMTRIRCFRMETDIVRDQVAEEILKELSLCDEVKDLYIRLLDQIKMQLEELRTAKQRLECDWSDKTEAYEIDVNCRGLSSDSNTILWKSGSVKMPPDQSSSSGYEYSIRQVIAEGQTAKERSSTLRVNVNSIIENAVRDLRSQGDRLDLALTEQIQLQEQALRRLENELYKDLRQLADTENLVDHMREASKRLDGTMKCAQTRLDNRLHRHGVESCRDVPQFGIIEEVKSLAENVSATLGQLKRTDDSTVSLIETRRKIEKELVVKRKSLYVDRERCQQLRSFYPSAQALAGN